jgi:hypothetical protein
MHTQSRWLIVPALVVGVASFLLAQDPVVERTTGKVLLLTNGNVVEGDIVKIGTQMCVRRGKSEVWIGIEQTTRLCADWDDAYAHLQARLKLASADERLKFARWCHLHQLKDKALEQGKLAMQLDPDHLEAKRFVAMLERTLKDTSAKPGVPAAPPAAVAPSTPHIDVSAETFANFMARVQPILMNKCAACHAGGGFRLDRAGGGGHQVAGRHNLNAVLAYLDVDKPAHSPLLVKAIEAHGGAAFAPFKDRKELPVQILQAWIEQTIAANPSVKEYYAAKKPAKATEEVKTAALPAATSAGPVLVSRPLPRIEITAEPKAPPPSVAVESNAVAQQPQAQLDYLQAMARKQPLPLPVQKIAGSLQQQIERGNGEPSIPKAASRPTPVAQPIDPFDPVLFNQANYPHGPSWLSPSRPSVSANR